LSGNPSALDIFNEQRRLLFGVAYRMLGSAADAEDIVQEAFIRWSAVDTSQVESPRAYLTTVVTRLSIDQLRSARVVRESYKGPWLPDPVPAESGSDLADDLSLAFLVLLEELAPAERAAFLLREVFGYEYQEIATVLDRNEPACRQLVSRAKHRVGDRRRRFDADRETSQELTRRFVLACATGNVSELMSLLTEDVVIWADGGGKAKASPRPVVGPWRAARFLVHIPKTFSENTTYRETMLNGQPGLVFEIEGTVTAAVVLDIMHGKIAGIRIISNPDKLSALSTSDEHR
jgi:RNA polymerase sigma-70 factor (ECF subfamily)